MLVVIIKSQWQNSVMKWRKMTFKNVQTLLNSGNIIFSAKSDDIESLEKTISNHLETVFGFPIPTLLRPANIILDLLNQDPFKGIHITKDIRLYVSFLSTPPETELNLPWISNDQSFKILSKDKKTIISVLDLSISKTPKAMNALEKFYGKRYYNTKLEHHSTNQ